MITKDINIERIKPINELYVLIDENAFFFERSWSIRDIWANYKNQTIINAEKQKAQWEINCFIFEIRGKTVFSQVYSNSKSKKYPNKDFFDSKLTDYVKERASIAENPIIKARYNHLLWKGPSGIKNNSFAIAAIENYHIAIQEYINTYQSDKYKSKDINSNILGLYEKLVIIYSEVKTDISPIKNLTEILLFQTSGLDFWVKHHILETMLKYSKLFKPDDFKNKLQIFDDVLTGEKETVKNFLLVNNYLPTALNIAQKTVSDVRKWYNELGFANLNMANEITNENKNWIKLSFYFEAIKAFSKASNVDMKNKVEKLYAELRAKVLLSEYRVDFNKKTQQEFQDYQKYIQEKAELILQNTPHDIYKIIASGILFPKYSDVVKISENTDDNFSMFATQIHFDKNQNIIKNQEASETNQKIYKAYGYCLKFSVLPYLHYVIIWGIKSGHLTFENFILYLAQNTWIGKRHERYNLDIEKKPKNLLGLVTPSIVEFFMQVKAVFTTQDYTPSFVLCVDSLTLKMEGVFRSFCNMMNIPTSFLKPKGMQEAFIHEILEFETLKNHFNEDDLLLFNYLFLNEGGMNLRNNVAHCFYDYEEYHQDQMLLLLAALLRISNFDYSVNE